MQLRLPDRMQKDLQGLRAIVASLDHPPDRPHLLLDLQMISQEDPIKDNVKLEEEDLLQIRLHHPQKLLRSTEKGLVLALLQQLHKRHRKIKNLQTKYRLVTTTTTKVLIMILVKEGVHHLLRLKTLVASGVKIRQKVEGMVMDIKKEGVEAARLKTEESRDADH